MRQGVRIKPFKEACLKMEDEMITNRTNPCNLNDINVCLWQDRFPQISLLMDFLKRKGVREDLTKKFEDNYEEIKASRLVKESLDGLSLIAAIYVAVNADVLDFLFCSFFEMLKKEEKEIEDWHIIREAQSGTAITND